MRAALLPRAAADPGSQIQAQSKDTDATFPSPLARRPLPACAPPLMHVITTSAPATAYTPFTETLGIPAGPETTSQSGPRCNRIPTRLTRAPSARGRFLRELLHRFR
jgi:hypothetical protein